MAATSKMYQHAQKRLLQIPSLKYILCRRFNARQRARLIAASRFGLGLGAGVAWGAGVEMYLWKKSNKEKMQKVSCCVTQFFIHYLTL